MTALVRAVRRQNGLTLQDLASATGLTRSYLSKIEREQSNPSISVAVKIATALGVDVGRLFASPSESAGPVVDRAGEPSSRERYVPLATGLLGKTMSPFIVRPTFEFASDRHEEHSGDELVFVRSGRIELTVDDEIISVGEGDSVYLDGSRPHRMRSVSPVEAEVLVVISQSV